MRRHILLYQSAPSFRQPICQLAESIVAHLVNQFFDGRTCYSRPTVNQDVSFSRESGLGMGRSDDPFATSLFKNDFVSGLDSELCLQVIRQLNAP